MRYSGLNEPADSAQGSNVNEYENHAGTSRVCRRRDDYDIQRRALQGLKKGGKFCFGTCGRPGDVKRVENYGGSCSTQTWEPWTRGTCVSRSLRLQKSNQTLIIGPNGAGRILALENELCSNDDYNRIFELRYESNDRDRIPIVAKISTITRKTNAFHDSICEALRKPSTFAEKAVQIDLVELYKITICDPAKDQPENSNLEKNPVGEKHPAVPETRLSPGPSTSGIQSKRKLINKTAVNSPALKKKRSVNLSVKKKPAIKKRSTIAGSRKKLGKKIIAPSDSSSRTRATKVPMTAKKSLTKTPKKLTRLIEANEKKVGSNHHVVAAAEPVAEKIVIEKEAETSRADVIEESKEIEEPSVNESEIKNQGEQSVDEEVKDVGKIREVSAATREFQERRISLPEEAFEFEKDEKDEVASEALADSVSRCSSKCQGVPLHQNDYGKRPTSSSSSSKKQLENGSTLSDRVDQARRKSYRVKRKSTLKSPRANSSTSNSSECEDLYSSSIKKKIRPPKSSLPRLEKSKEIVTPKREKPIAVKNQEDKSEVVSSDESGEKSTSTVPVNEDPLQQSRSLNPVKVGRQKSPRRRRGCSQSSVMMIWHWLRKERHQDASANEFPSLIGSNDRVKDPFLSLIYPNFSIIENEYKRT